MWQAEGTTARYPVKEGKKRKLKVLRAAESGNVYTPQCELLAVSAAS